MWIFNNNRNHDLAIPSEKRFLRVNKSKTPYARNLIHALDATNILSNQQYSYVVMQSGGFSSCSFTKGDFYNLCRDDKENIKSHDVNLLIQN